MKILPTSPSSVIFIIIFLTLQEGLVASQTQVMTNGGASHTLSLPDNETLTLVLLRAYQNNTRVHVTVGGEVISSQLHTRVAGLVLHRINIANYDYSFVALGGEVRSDLRGRVNEVKVGSDGLVKWIHCKDTMCSDDFPLPTPTSRNHHDAFPSSYHPKTQDHKKRKKMRPVIVVVIIFVVGTAIFIFIACVCHYCHNASRRKEIEGNPIQRTSVPFRLLLLLLSLHRLLYLVQFSHFDAPKLSLLQPLYRFVIFQHFAHHHHHYHYHYHYQ
ncbi:hypothetical protein Pcinc_019122 [Petrolisthes cinctipes]|uniref:Uncharacterized protein n=1 Tax=Petrolisthes cinctipes TaxID=88211 RepID=A0AAE1FMV0_PETCI|nr:hypothetical protein Pcinc_019122 [Petrolisthes cinctipes]